MAIWEYKVISSGKGGFATPAMLEKFLNDLGKQEWEVIEFHSPADNSLAFSGLARRSTQRDWTLEDAAASAAKAEADKLRAEFEAKFKGMSAGPATVDEEESALAQQVSPDGGYRSPVDTSRDQDPDADDDEDHDAPKDEWEALVEDDDLPTFFEAIRPHMRRNQRGPGTSVGVDQLARKWGFDDADIIGALKECGFEIPEEEDEKPAYLEYDGDLYWVNVNRRGETWINTKEKPRPVFRTVKGERATVEEAPKPEAKKKPEQPKEAPKKSEAAASTPAPAKEAKPETSGATLPAGQDLLEKIRPKMRRNRHDAGGSGSVSFLTRAFKCTEADLLAGFTAMGLTVPEKNGDKGEVIEVGPDLWWINKDQRGGIWINGIEKAEMSADATNGEPAPSDPASAVEAASGSILTSVRSLLKPARNGAFASEIPGLAEALKQSSDDLVAALVAAGLSVPEKPRQKPDMIEFSGDSLWLTRNAKDVLSLNAKAVEGAAPQSATQVEAAPAKAKVPAKKSRGPRSRKKPGEKDAD